MRTFYYIIIAAMAVIPAVVSLADNTIVGPDIPWEEDGNDTIPTAITAVTADGASPGSTVTADGAASHRFPSVGEGRGDAPLYDLQGRRVTTPQPGKIYIIAGKKVLWAQ